ncbi:MAG: hypothetical protein WBB85_21085, partial [Albidovulum sp.]|uniref:hypothetical protein n=1 Tax=Albidovulum sp. TaxID=1872424 RepID=UPI003CAF2AEA
MTRLKPLKLLHKIQNMRERNAQAGLARARASVSAAIDEEESARVRLAEGERNWADIFETARNGRVCSDQPAQMISDLQTKLGLANYALLERQAQHNLSQQRVLRCETDLKRLTDAYQAVRKRTRKLDHIVAQEVALARLAT